jgi:hypothetical protein
MLMTVSVLITHTEGLPTLIEQSADGKFTPTGTYRGFATLAFLDDNAIELVLPVLPGWRENPLKSSSPSHPSEIIVAPDRISFRLGLRCTLLSSDGFNAPGALQFEGSAAAGADGWVWRDLILDGNSATLPGTHSLSALSAASAFDRPLLRSDARRIGRAWAHDPGLDWPLASDDKSARFKNAEDCLALGLLGSGQRWRDPQNDYGVFLWFESAAIRVDDPSAFAASEPEFVQTLHARHRLVLGRELDDERWARREPASPVWSEAGRIWSDDDAQADLRTRLQSRLRAPLRGHALWTGIELFAGAGAPSPVVSQALPWKSDFVRQPEWLIRLHRLPAASFRGAWNDGLSKVLAEQLGSLAGPGALSLVPTLSDRNWLGEASVRLHDPGAFGWFGFWSIQEPNHPRLTTPLHLDASPPVNSGALPVHMAGFRSHSGKPLNLLCKAARAQAAETDQDDLSDFVWQGSPEAAGATDASDCVQVYEFRARIDGSGQPDVDALRTLRLGALDLRVRQSGISAGAPLLLLRFAVRQRLEVLPVRARATWSARLRAELPLDLVQPGGTDPLPEQSLAGVRDEEHSASALVYLPQPLPARAYSLHVDERYEAGRERRFDVGLHLQEPDKTPSGRHFVYLIDRAPLFVGAFELSNALGQADETRTQVGALRVNGDRPPVWNLATRAADTEILLPPQALGEEIERRESDPFDADAPVRQRLGPLLRMDVALRSEDEQFAPAPWNWRYRFGHPLMPQALGAQVRAADLELLYGLACQFQASDIVLTEAQTLRGRIAAELDEDGVAAALKPQAQQWNALRRHYRDRVALLSASRTGTAGFRITERDGLSLRLRDNADLRAPMALPAPNPGDPPQLPDAPGGLLGGAIGGIESLAIYRALWRDPVANSGELNRWQVSALGGWGDTKASFDNKRSSIQASVSMGRVTHYAVERIGRIGVYWNRAKHVIVYERTVARPQRYAANGDPELQHERHRQPVVRKVDEYVEILEQERQFPDRDNGSAQATGPLRAIRFHTRVLRVKTEWTEAVGDLALRIPLWRLGIRADLAPLFPKPQVTLLMAVTPAAHDELAECAIDDPHNLCFYTTTDASLDDRTDLWPAAAGVDYVALPDPAPPGAAFTDANLDVPVPPPAAVPPGFERFSWRLTPASTSAAINLVAGRQSRPLSAPIETLTLQRGSGAADSSAAGALISAAQEKLTRLRARAELIVAAAARNGSSEAQIAFALFKHELQQELADFRALAALQGIATVDVCAVLCGQAADELNRGRSAILAEFSALGATIEASVGRLLQLDAQARSELLHLINLGGAQAINALNRLLAVFGHSAQDLDGLNEAIGDVNARIGPIRRQIDEWIALQRARGTRELGARVAALEQQWANLDLALCGAGEYLAQQGLLQRLQRFEPLRAPLTALIDGYAQAHAKLRTAALTWLADMRQGAADWELRLQEVQDRAQQWTASVTANAALLTDAAQALVGQLEGINERAGLVIETVRAGCRQELDRLRQLIIDSGDDLQTLRAALPARLQSLSTILATTTAAAIGSCADAPGANTLLAIVHHDLCEALLAKIGSTLKQALDTALRLFNDLLAAASLDATALQWLQDLRGRLNQLLPDLTGVLDELLRGLPGGVKTSDLGLSLKRMFGGLPQLPGLSFNASRVAYYFKDLVPDVDLTPVTAWFDRIGDHLKALGLRLPTVSFGDGLESGQFLSGLQLNRLFPDFAGLKLDGLFNGLKFPQIDARAVRVRYGIDRDRRLGWVEADISVPLGQRASLFDVASVELLLIEPRLLARSRLEIDEGGRSSVRMEAKIPADWQVRLAGQALVTLADTTLSMDQRGRFSVDFQPDKIRFNGALQPLRDLLATLSDPDSGFTLGLLERDGHPFGVEAKLDLLLPPISFGTFGLTGLSLGARLALAADPNFFIEANLNLGRERMPFTITVFILGGAGYLEFDSRYEPGRTLDTRLALAVGASAMIGINLGPVRGHVQVFFGLRASFSTSGNQRSFAVAIIVTLNGAVVVWGFIHIGLYVGLEIEYRDDGAMTGRGHVSVEVRISQFIKRSFKSRLTYQFQKGKRAGNSVEGYRDSRV